MQLRPQLLLALILVVFTVGAGCTPSSQSKAEANRHLVRQFVAATDEKNFSAYDELLSPEMIQHSPGGVDLDRNQVEKAERAFAEAFPDASRTIDLLLAEGDKVMIRETFQGTHAGAFQGIPATGNTVELTANAVYRIANAKIVESWVEADFGGFVASLSSAPLYSPAVDEVSGSSEEANAVISVQRAKVNSLENGDFSAWLDLHTDDVVFVPPGGKIEMGKDALQQWGEPFFENFVIEDTETVDEVLVSGDLAVLRYSYVNVFTPTSGGESASDKGRGLVVYTRRGDGQWKIARHVWNDPPVDSD